MSNDKNNVHAILLARKNSKSVKRKNIRLFNGKPLIYWTLNHCLKSKYISNIWVSSDSQEILNYSAKFGAKKILRPKKLASHKASSESGWLHAINIIKKTYDIDKIPLILAPQITSPVRKDNDFDLAIKKMFNEKLDSLFSGTLIEDFFIWKNKTKLKAHYQMNKRPRRQEITPNILENGSFYIFSKKNFIKKKIRLFGKIGNFVQSKLKSFQIDTHEDLLIVNTLMGKLKNDKK